MLRPAEAHRCHELRARCPSHLLSCCATTVPQRRPCCRARRGRASFAGGGLRYCGALGCAQLSGELIAVAWEFLEQQEGGGEVADSGVAAGGTRKACRGRSSTSLASLRRLFAPRWTICRLKRHSLSQHVCLLMRTKSFDQVGGPRQEERERRRAPIQLTGLPCCWCL